MFLGLDIGSSSSKAVILNEKKEIIAAEVINLGTGTRGVREVLALAFARAGCTQEDISYSVVTGYGRMTFTGADEQITEISCHAKGVRYCDQDARTVIDIGGQDSKVIRIEADGTVSNFVMNDKCAAGTGRFLEVMARVLDSSVAGLSTLAKEGHSPVSISNMCTVFAESEVISQLSSGASPADVASGAILSIATRVSGMAGRVGVVPKVLMTGGGALNEALVDAIAQTLRLPVEAAAQPQTMGALGAAVFAFERAARAVQAAEA